MKASGNSSQIGTACRIYKNSDNKVIAIDDICIIGDLKRITADRYFYSTSCEVKRSLFHLANNNRVISTISMIGNYSSVEYDAGNFRSALWEQADNTDDVDLVFTSVSFIGDEI